MPKRQRDYKQEYANRVRKAKIEGYQGYGQKRYRTEKAHKQRLRQEQEGIQALFPDAVIFTENLTRWQREAVNRLEQYGIDRDELNTVLNAGPDFWKEARPLLERESELAKGH